MKPKSPTPEEISEHRRWANITQEEAAEMVYTTPKTWWRWEAGRTKMHPSRWELFLIKTHEYVRMSIKNDKSPLADPARLEDMMAFASKLKQNSQQARDFFQKAGILTKSGRLTKQYRNE